MKKGGINIDKNIRDPVIIFEENFKKYLKKNNRTEDKLYINSSNQIYYKSLFNKKLNIYILKNYKAKTNYNKEKNTLFINKIDLNKKKTLKLIDKLALEKDYNKVKSDYVNDLKDKRKKIHSNCNPDDLNFLDYKIYEHGLYDLKLRIMKNIYNDEKIDNNTKELVSCQILNGNKYFKKFYKKILEENGEY